ncbi:IS66 family insertion sequence element accessory protein TnpB, partial [Sinorhizobium meliloti]|uniref:IS66 family insertion sequence element accessory protein TnpB n=1 Tax=Rhizobium meliloti TaxID=382 RepID=UPI00398D4C27
MCCAEAEGWCSLRVSRQTGRKKLLYYDGQGFCLYYNILQRGRFPWPSAADGTARLTTAQLAMLWDADFGKSGQSFQQVADR